MPDFYGRIMSTVSQITIITRFSGNTATDNEMKNEKKIYLEILRIVAILCVIFNHTGPYGYELFTYDHPAFLKVIGIFLSNYAKIGVPVFFMVSGALLIPREEDGKTLLLKRVLKMAVILIVISFIYYIRLYIKHPEYGFSIKFFIETIYTSPFITPLWFLYRYIEFLLMLPLLKHMIRNMSKTDFGYLLLLCTAFLYAMPLISFVIGDGPYMKITLLEKCIIYPLWGYFLDTSCDNIIMKQAPDITKNRWMKKPVSAAAVLIILNGAFCVFMTFLNNRFRGEWVYDFVDAFIFIPALCTFFIVRSVCKNLEQNSRIAVIAGYIGSDIFVTFLFEEMLREDICMSVYRTFGGHQYDFLLFIPYALLLLTLGVILSRLLKMIPFLKKWL